MAPKNVASVRLVLSLLSTSGGLYPVKDSSGERDTGLKMVCPSCKNSLLDQVYCCQAGCTPDANAPALSPHGWKTGEVGSDRVRVEGKGKDAKLTFVSGDEIEAAKAGTVLKGEMSLAIYPANEVEKATWPGGTTYCFEPETADKVYAMLLTAAGDTTKALIGIINMRGTEKLYRLVAHEGTLRVVELLRPEETVAYQPLALPVVEAREEKMFNDLLGTLSDTFDPEAYASTSLANLRDLIESKNGGATILAFKGAGVAASKKADTVDLLQAALDQAKAKSA